MKIAFPRGPRSVTNAMHNSMHRKFIVAIEAKISNRRLAATRGTRQDGKSDVVIAIGAMAGAISRHRILISKQRTFFYSEVG